MVNVWIFWLTQQNATVDMLQSLYYRFGLVPAEYTLGVDLTNDGLPYWLTLGSSLFLQAGVMHLVGNLIYLGWFGAHVERQLGSTACMLIFGLSGLAGNALHVMAQPYSTVPCIGSSGAIFGLIGAAWLLYPWQASWSSLTPGQRLYHLGSVLLVGVWLGHQGLLSAVSTIPHGVATMAHWGGLAAGCLITGLLLSCRRIPAPETADSYAMIKPHAFRFYVKAHVPDHAVIARPSTPVDAGL